MNNKNKTQVIKDEHKKAFPDTRQKTLLKHQRLRT
jgi:hypothetical protein